MPGQGVTADSANRDIFAGAKKTELKDVNKVLATVFLFALISGCSSKPPMPPEPEGPLIKVNINQPHETYQGDKK